MKKSKKEKTRIFILTIAIIFLSVALITSVTDNIKTIIFNKESLSELEIYYEELIKEEESLKSELIKLSDEDYLVRYAKEKYLYSEDGELIIRFNK